MGRNTKIIGEIIQNLVLSGGGGSEFKKIRCGAKMKNARTSYLSQLGFRGLKDFNSRALAPVPLPKRPDISQSENPLTQRRQLQMHWFFKIIQNLRAVNFCGVGGRVVQQRSGSS